MNKTELLSEIDLALENHAWLLLRASDYFTDYIKAINPYTLPNFKQEVELYCTDDGLFDEKPYVKIDSIDILNSGTGEKNQYFAILRKLYPLKKLKLYLVA